MTQLALGKLNKLAVKKQVEFGVYLDGLSWGDILLPKRYVPAGTEIGTVLEVLLYLDSEDQLIATTEKPYVMVGQVAQLKAVAITKVGAFLNWGLKKDLLVPFSEQQIPMQLDKYYLVYCYVDKSNRIVASAKLDRYIGKERPEYQPGDEVQFYVASQTDLGYKVVVDHKHWGLLYKNQVFKSLRIGYKGTAYVQKIRDDFRIDLMLDKPGYEKAQAFTDVILERLKHKGGSLSISDKSSPEQIYGEFGVSKKVFKAAIGALYKAGKIVIEAEAIRLTQTQSN